MSKKRAARIVKTASLGEVERQIREMQREIRFDTRDFPIETIVKWFLNEQIFIPRYQREFVWNENDQSQFIESVLMGLPIPMMFLGEVADGTLEIVDGAQRIQTLVSFTSNDLMLSGLTKLTTLNGYRYEDLPQTQKNKFWSRALRMVILDQETTDENRLELFDRINKHGRKTTPSERRRGALSGKFMDFLEACAEKPLFKKLCPVSEPMRKRKEPLELVTRFFAYSERYKQFRHDVDEFLDQFVRDYKSKFPQKQFEGEFDRMLRFVERFFPYGFAKSATASTTPRVRFEALSVGINLALRKDQNLNPAPVVTWLESSEFAEQTTTHASNSTSRMSARIEYVRNHLLENRLPCSPS